jgi:soluble lytic murein transglycosylase-like protein
MPWWVGLSILLNAGLIAGFFWVSHVTATEVSALTDQVQGASTRTAELASEARALRGEVRGLRQYLSSQAEEDVLFLKIMYTKPRLDQELARTVARHVARYATLYRQDPDLVLAIIAVESGFNPRAISGKGATGLMQVMPQWKRVLGIQEDLTDPETSIKYGLQILGFYSEMYKDREMALTAYNRGPGPVDMALMRGEHPGNHYAPRVLKTYEKLKALQVGSP